MQAMRQDAMGLEVASVYSVGHSGTTRLVAIRHSALSEQRGGPECLPRSPQRVTRRLETDVVEQILADYRSGLPSTVLAGRHGVASPTVIAMLRRRLVVARRQPVQPADRHEALRRYGLGWSLAKIGRRLDRPPNSIRNALGRAGIARRSPNFRPHGS